MPKRFRLDVALPRTTPPHDFRHPEETDIPALGALMWGTVRVFGQSPDAAVRAGCGW
jgi:hypothetical protein